MAAPGAPRGGRGAGGLIVTRTGRGARPSVPAAPAGDPPLPAPREAPPSRPRPDPRPAPLPRTCGRRAPPGWDLGGDPHPAARPRPAPGSPHIRGGGPLASAAPETRAPPPRRPAPPSGGRRRCPRPIAPRRPLGARFWGGRTRANFSGIPDPGPLTCQLAGHLGALLGHGSCATPRLGEAGAARRREAAGRGDGVAAPRHPPEININSCRSAGGSRLRLHDASWQLPRRRRD